MEDWITDIILSLRLLMQIEKVITTRLNKLKICCITEITEWIKWHTKSIEKSIDISLQNIEKVIKKTRFYDKIRYLKLNEKQNKVINRLLDVGEGNFEGGLTNKKYRALTKTDAVTASRHLKDLVNKGVIREIEGFAGRNSRYQLSI